MTTKTHDEFKPNTNPTSKEAEPLRTVSDIIDFYKNRKS